LALNILYLRREEALGEKSPRNEALGTARASMNGRIAGIYFCPQLLGF
jgi:hypothetical protein